MELLALGDVKLLAQCTVNGHATCSAPLLLHRHPLNGDGQAPLSPPADDEGDLGLGSPKGGLAWWLVMHAYLARHK